MGAILHTPHADVIDTLSMGRLLKKINTEYNIDLKTFADLHDYSVNSMEDFWNIALQDLGVIFQSQGSKILDDSDKMLGGQFFTDSTINFEENLMKKTGTDDCLVYRSEDKINYRLSCGKVRTRVSKLQQFLSDKGVVAGDVVAGFLPNFPKAVIAILA